MRCMRSGGLAVVFYPLLGAKAATIFHQSCNSTQPSPAAGNRHLTCCPTAEATACTHTPICSGQRVSRDAIVYIAQKKHSSYDSSHNSSSLLLSSIASLAEHYAALQDADLLIWHEGDLVPSDLEPQLPRSGVNVRLCRLSCCTGWGVPPTVTDIPSRFNRARSSWYAPGYLFMIRWYALTSWEVLDDLGYEWVMRFDDDSILFSRVPYNFFDTMRQADQLYGYRMLAQLGPIECRESEQVLRGAGLTPRCDSTGFYNNWFVTRVRWWLSDRVLELRRSLERTRLIFTDRFNDLAFHSLVVHTLLKRTQRHHFLDWSYEHATVKYGKVSVGGFEVGDAIDAAKTVAGAWKAARHPKQSAIIRSCEWRDAKQSRRTTVQVVFKLHETTPMCDTATILNGSVAGDMQ